MPLRLAVAHSRSLNELDLARRPLLAWVSAEAASAQITVRLANCSRFQGGLIAIDQPVTTHANLPTKMRWPKSWRGEAAWTPGVQHGYHTLTLGWYQSRSCSGELIRSGGAWARFSATKSPKPLNAEFDIGLPKSIDDERLARTKGFHRLSLLWHLGELPPRMVLSGIWPQLG